MKEIQKKITLIIWGGSILIGSANQLWLHWNVKLLYVMFFVSVLASVLYFLPISDRLKAILVLSATGLGTLGLSIMGGGNSGTFIASFMVLGMALLYFDQVIIIGYTAIYLTICLITFWIKPSLLIGVYAKPLMGHFMILSYLMAAIALIIATKYGQNYMQMSRKEERAAQEKAAIIAAKTSATQKNSAQLSEKMKETEQTVNELNHQANIAYEQIMQAQKSEEETAKMFEDLMLKIYNSTEEIGKNYELIEDLTKSFEATQEKVLVSKEFSENTKQSMDDILAAIKHAYESIVKSSAEIDRIEAIIEDINEIASQTNLLAINAAIEAARVGVNGTGFGIVAEQIRSLSMESKQASEHIQKILAVLTELLNQTRDKVWKGMEAIAHGGKQLERMFASVETIDRYSNQSKETLNQEVTVFEHVKEEFSEMVMEVEKAMCSAEASLSNLQVVVEVIHSQTDNTNRVSEQLKEIDGMTTQLVSHF